MEQIKTGILGAGSRKNTCGKLAESLADRLADDIYGIVPQEPYTPGGLNYNDGSSRSTAEMDDASCRLAIVGIWIEMPAL